MVYIPREMSDELIARFRVGCPILLCYSFVGVHDYIIIELSQKDGFFIFDGMKFIKEEDIQVSELIISSLGDTLYRIKDSKGVHTKFSCKISLETFEKVCQKLMENL